MCALLYWTLKRGDGMDEDGQRIDGGKDMTAAQFGSCLCVASLCSLRLSRVKYNIMLRTDT